MSGLLLSHLNAHNPAHHTNTSQFRHVPNAVAATTDTTATEAWQSRIEKPIAARTGRRDRRPEVGW